MKNVVVIGGGSGLSSLLRGIRDYPLDIKAIVAVTDDGASSGVLRQDFKMLPPGDIRKCIAALSADESALIRLFEYRFKNGIGLKGHSFGNLFLTALKEINGSMEAAIEEASKLLKIKGAVIPVTLARIGLIAQFDNGRQVCGESKITRYGYHHKISRIRLSKAAKSNPGAISAIKDADVIFVGPGSLYTSILPNFLIKKVVEAFNSSPAFKVYVCNVSAERGETEGMSVNDHFDILLSYGLKFDAVLINNKSFLPMSGDGYISPVLEGETALDCVRIFADLLSPESPLYHCPNKLGRVAYKIILNSKKIASNSASRKVYDY